jgi:aspartyl/glutamyl-tRNA(Asn/Gln) amidotransferase C subunit
MKLTIQEVKEISELARVDLAEDEIIGYQKDFSAVLDHFEKLSELNTDKVEEIGHITGMNDVFRKDKADGFKTENQQLLMDNVLAERDGYIEVKSVF